MLGFQFPNPGVFTYIDDNVSYKENQPPIQLVDRSTQTEPIEIIEPEEKTEWSFNIPQPPMEKGYYVIDKQFYRSIINKRKGPERLKVFISNILLLTQDMKYNSIRRAISDGKREIRFKMDPAGIVLDVQYI